jgi:ATP-dependent protease ClpP protease subunit
MSVQGARNGPSDMHGRLLSKRGPKRARWAVLGDATADDADEGEEAAALVTRDGTAVYFRADVTKRSVLQLLRQLREATLQSLREATDPLREPGVTLYIHSEGGDAFAGLSAHDHIVRNRVPVTTVADGMVASAASLLLLAGQHRYAMRHSFVLIHQLSVAGFAGKYAELLDEVKNSQALMDAYEAIYAARTSLAPKRLEQLLKKEVALDAETCVREGFVEAIM